MSVLPFGPCDNLAAFSQILKEFVICKANVVIQKYVCSHVILFAVCFLLSIFQVIDNMFGKLYITSCESSVCLNCEYPNIHSRGVTFSLMVECQGHVYALKLVTAPVYRKVQVMLALSFL